MKQIIIFIVLILLPIVTALDECKGTITTEESPCIIIIPFENCSQIEIAFYNNESTFLDQRVMTEYSPFTCQATFNYSTPQTYTFNYTTGDSGSIIVEEEEMLRFFNLGVYALFLIAVFVLTLFMHKYKDEGGTAIVYGTFAAAISLIMVGMIASGFELVRNVIFFFDVDYYFMLLMLSWAVYTIAVSVNMYKSIKREQQPKEDW